MINQFNIDTSNPVANHCTVYQIFPMRFITFFDSNAAQSGKHLKLSILETESTWCYQ